jgi:hypothetical protein
VQVDDGALDRAFAVEAFDGDERAAVDHRQEGDAGVDCAWASLRVDEHHRAGATVAFGAAFLRPGEPASVPEPV